MGTEIANKTLNVLTDKQFRHVQQAKNVFNKVDFRNSYQYNLIDFELMNKIEPKSIYNFKFKEKLKAELKPE